MSILDNLFNKSRKKDTATEKVTSRLSDNQRKTLEYLSEKSKINEKARSEALKAHRESKLNPSKAKRDLLEKLKKEGGAENITSKELIQLCDASMPLLATHAAVEYIKKEKTNKQLSTLKVTTRKDNAIYLVGVDTLDKEIFQCKAQITRLCKDNTSPRHKSNNAKSTADDNTKQEIQAASTRKIDEAHLLCQMIAKGCHFFSIVDAVDDKIVFKVFFPSTSPNILRKHGVKRQGDLKYRFNNSLHRAYKGESTESVQGDGNVK